MARVTLILTSLSKEPKKTRAHQGRMAISIWKILR
jgi:hypothetical protein